MPLDRHQRAGGDAVRASEQAKTGLIQIRILGLKTQPLALYDFLRALYLYVLYTYRLQSIYPLKSLEIPFKPHLAVKQAVWSACSRRHFCFLASAASPSIPTVSVGRSVGHAISAWAIKSMCDRDRPTDRPLAPSPLAPALFSLLSTVYYHAPW